MDRNNSGAADDTIGGMPGVQYVDCGGAYKMKATKTRILLREWPGGIKTLEIWLGYGAQWFNPLGESYPASDLARVWERAKLLVGSDAGSDKATIILPRNAATLVEF